MKRSTLVLLLAVTFPAISQLPQSDLRIWVNEDGSQGFQLRIVFLGNDEPAETVERDARNSIPIVLAEKQWCLRGWSIDKREVLPTDRPKGTVVTLSGSCK